jgi:hypothetical protein
MEAEWYEHSTEPAFQPANKYLDLLLFERLTEANLPEENYYDWSYRPIRQEDGTVGGFINDCFDVTDKV